MYYSSYDVYCFHDFRFIRYIRYKVYASDSSVLCLLCGFNWHSHMVMQCHPIDISLSRTSLSRTLLRSTFAAQKSVFDSGTLKYLHPSCPCQKHPFTKMHVLYFLSTMSGFPGNLVWLSLYLKPRPHRNFRTSISGFVSFPFIEAMHLCRCSGVSLSIVELGVVLFFRRRRR